MVDGFLTHFDRYLQTIGPTISFLQGRDPTLAHRICSRTFLPEGPRFDSLEVYYDPDGGDPKVTILFDNGEQRTFLASLVSDKLQAL